MKAMPTNSRLKAHHYPKEKVVVLVQVVLLKIDIGVYLKVGGSLHTSID